MAEGIVATSHGGIGLIVKDRLEVPTANGPCEIQLAYGSVTKLSAEDKVDVLVLSAFPNSYEPTPWSVLGALQRDLGIIVKELAINKEEDLRNIFSCWWSKELPPECNFRRILCFEGAYKPGATPPAVIGEIFRCLVSLCKNNEIKVMMPMVATGHQGYEYDVILRLIFEAATHWMQIGLPLRILKLVVFSKDLKQTKSDSSLISYFAVLKKNWLQKQSKKNREHKVTPVNYDVYLSYCPKDENLANKVVKTLTAIFKEIKIFLERQVIDSEKSWQKKIYKVMVSCARVITILSPNYLADESCLEQYNMALCCTRNMKRDYLAPFYVENIDLMPTYMCLIQYLDCRPFNDDNISKACHVVTNWLHTNQSTLKEIKEQEPASQTTSMPASFSSDHYDVFISYSHRNSDAAQVIKEHIMNLHPDWKIFIDIADLKTGVAWQTKLYNSIEKSKIILALLSPTYIASKVCQEEYNLALAIYCDPAYTTVLFPIMVERIEMLPHWCKDYEPLNLSDKNIPEFLNETNLLKELDDLRKPSLTIISEIAAEWREQNVRLNHPYISAINGERIAEVCKKKNKTIGEKPTIVLCYHATEKSQVKFFSKRLKSCIPGAMILEPDKSNKGNVLIDEADLVVLFLSPAFLTTAELVEQANIILCRQRTSDRLVLLTVILADLPKEPAYFHLFPCFFACADEIWLEKRLNAKSRFPWLCFSRASKKTLCIDSAACFAAFVLSNKPYGSFKTLLNWQELHSSSCFLKENTSEFSTVNNPLLFEEM